MIRIIFLCWKLNIFKFFLKKHVNHMRQEEYILTKISMSGRSAGEAGTPALPWRPTTMRGHPGACRAVVLTPGQTSSEVPFPGS